MKIVGLGLILALLGCATSSPIDELEKQDNYIWLEEIQGDKALNWVKEENQITVARLQRDSRFSRTERQIEDIITASDRIPYVGQGQGWLYNFWQDKKNVRGVWRRTAVGEYRKDRPFWNVLIDVDQLSKAEKENWVWKGHVCLPDDSRCLVFLSRGGTDAKVVREFDPLRRRFVEGGFQVPQAKSNVAWDSKDSVYVATDFGPDSLTASGYPRIVKLWRRGQSFSEMETLFEGEKSDVSVEAYTVFRPEGAHSFIEQSVTFWETKYFYIPPGQPPVELVRPLDSSFWGVFKGYGLWKLRSAWSAGGQSFSEGSVVALPLEAHARGELRPSLLFQPTPTQTVGGISDSKNALYLTYTDNVQTRVLRIELEGQSWKKTPILIPDMGVAGVFGASAWSDQLYLSYENMLEPTGIYALDIKSAIPIKFKSLPARFDSSTHVGEQRWATSRDGTKIPFFVVRPKLQKGPLPTHLYGYGGFEVIEHPNYLSVVGKVWLERGNVFVRANIRGGGEFGPKWHKAAIKTGRQRGFDDFIAVAEELIKAGTTTPQMLSIEGGSNGGLLVSAVMVQRPELFGAVLSGVPLTDMARYNKLLAGASWVGEYGDPNIPEERDALLKYSPYHNIKGGKYPEAFYFTSTLDDRVHPGHARKMVARLKEQSHSVLYFENTEGGHSAAANQRQRARKDALKWTFLYQHLDRLDRK